MTDIQTDSEATLYLISTPIGNAKDWSYRAVDVVKGLSALACEDTRLTWKLLTIYGIPRPPIMFANNEFNENTVADKITHLLKSGTSVGLCSDAGSPCIADPGYPAVAKAIEANIPVVFIPGPNAATAALALSGLPVSSYTFLGFAPRKTIKRRNFLSKEKDAKHTLIFYESPRRLAGLLEDALVVFGDRRVAVCIELTKMFENVRRDWLSVMVEAFREREVKGEVTVVIAGNNAKFIRKV